MVIQKDTLDINKLNQTKAELISRETGADPYKRNIPTKS